MARKATRTITLPGGRLKRWRNKQDRCSCVGELHFDIGRHPDQIRARIIERDIPYFEEDFIVDEEEEPAQISHGRKRRCLNLITRDNEIIAACA